jgi:hypothetical protein
VNSQSIGVLLLLSPRGDGARAAHGAAGAAQGGSHWRLERQGAHGHGSHGACCFLQFARPTTKRGEAIAKLGNDCVCQ